MDKREQKGGDIGEGGDLCINLQIFGFRKNVKDNKFYRLVLHF